jgi:hypothetical protein
MIAGQLSVDDQELFRRAFGARLSAEGKLALPVTSRHKVYTLMEVIGLPGSFALPAWMPERMSARSIFMLISFVFMMFALHLTVFVMLGLRRTLVLHQGSITAQLHQRQMAFPVALVLAEEGNIWSKRDTILKLDGGEFPLRRRIFASKSTVRAAMSRLEEWIRAQSHCLSTPCNASTPTQGTGSFLAFLDVVHSGEREVTFRSRHNPISVPRLWAASMMAMFLGAAVELFLSQIGLVSAAMLDVFAVMAFLFSVLWAVYLRTLQREITVRTGESIQVKWRNRIAAYPLWTCWFYAQPGDTQDPSSGPYRPHILLHFGDEVAILAVTGRYTREELDVFADRMNHFLWGSPNPPHDPDAPDDIPPYRRAVARNFIWVPSVIRPRTG